MASIAEDSGRIAMLRCEERQLIARLTSVRAEIERLERKVVTGPVGQRIETALLALPERRG